MKKYQKYAIALALLIGGVLLVPTTIIKGEEGKSGPAIGATIANFSLADANGVEKTLGLLKGSNGTVIIFISAKCPVVKGYNERMEKLATDYAARGIKVIGINSNSTESADDMKAHAADNKLSFVMLQDKGNKIADKLGASVTPEVFLLDANNKLVYHGRIDNSRSGTNIESNDLRDAMDAMLSGKPITKTQADAFGCSIKRA
jgi:peroxiredoxin